jgi:hypothetical protein
MSIEVNKVGDEDWWLSRKPLHSSGTLLFRDYRRQPPSNVNIILAMLAEIYRLYPQSPRSFWRAYAMLRGCARAFQHGCKSLFRHGAAARRQHGRSLFAQASDMWRAWWINGLPTSNYYGALLARHGGGSELLHYIGLHSIQPVVRELQLDIFGMPSVQINDKGLFGPWRRAQGLPGPKEIVLESQDPRLEASDLTSLGTEIMVKPRASGMGDGLEVWKLLPEGIWISGSQTLRTPDLIEQLIQRAAREPRGIVIQERLVNHPDIAEMCGKPLSTCRIVTILNERFEPEIVEYRWRMALNPDALVDTIFQGGISWAIQDIETGKIHHGTGPDATRLQQVSTHHPLTGKYMIGDRHPLGDEVCALALEAHRRLPDLLLAGWDIASSPEGPMLIEVNVPLGKTPRTFMVSDGLEHSRFGEILAWHARRWIERHVPKDSKRRVGSKLR